jgi:hypothetical protein
MNLERARFTMIAATFVACAACGSMDPSTYATDAGAGPKGPLLPWRTGNTWTYQVTEGALVSIKITTIGELEAVGGTGPNADKMAFKVVTKKHTGTDQTISWQTAAGDRVIRYREQAYYPTGAQEGTLEQEEHWDPYKLHIDGTTEHTVTGTTWLEDYMETKLPVGGQPATHEARDLWSVVSEAEPVTVPAGTFTAVLLQKAGGSTTKQYWYVRGIGKIKETGGQVEELVSYMVSP